MELGASSNITASTSNSNNASNPSTSDDESDEHSLGSYSENDSELNTDSEEEEDTELKAVLDRLQKHQEVEDTLSKESTSSGIIEKAETMTKYLHKLSFSSSQSLVTVLPSQSSTSENVEIVNALQTINARLEEFQAEPHGLPDHISPASALHAARQVAYWSSLFVSMCKSDQAEPLISCQSSLSTSTITNAHNTSSTTVHTPSTPSHPPTATIAHVQNTPSHPPTATIAHVQNTPSLPPTATIAHVQNTPSLPTTATIANALNTPSHPPTAIRITDINTLDMFRRYGRQEECSSWLSTLFIPRKVDSLRQVKEIWENGDEFCPPLKDWTPMMRNYKSQRGSNVSIFSQRKFIYNLYKKHNFDEDNVYSAYNEVKPGKLYKLLNTKQK